ncbi:MAG: DegT/DnrJ/EryC1/StrS family aminotransferase [Haloarculaceae archaeon]
MTQAEQRTIPLAKPLVSDEAKVRVNEVIESGQLASGDVVREFEREFADYCGTDHAVATANGTAALHAALEAIGVDGDSTVLTTPLSFVATANAVRLAGGEVVFADVDPQTGNLDPEAVEETLRETDGVDAIVPVHLYGLPAEMGPLRDIADEHDAVLIEDAAQAHGAEYEGAPVGSLGDLACFSFYPTKNMTTGEGGMVTTDSDELARRLRAFVNHGRDPEDGSIYRTVGHNFRLSNVAAAVGRSQLERLPAFVESRREHAALLTDLLADANVHTPPDPPHVRHAFHQYTIQVEERDRLRESLREFGIQTGVYYPRPIHEQPAYADTEVSAPVAERLSQVVLSLPVHPALSESDVRAVATAVEYCTSYE